MTAWQNERRWAKTDKPMVSIVIPAYNASNYLAEAIESALAQTYENIEILVINDGSADNGATEAIALSYGDKIRFYSKANGGVSSALNMGISQMKGTYFSWLSHDDKYEPNKISRQMETLLQYDSKDLIALCKSRQIDINALPIAGSTSKSFFQEGRIVKWDEALMTLINTHCFNGCAFLIPKTVFDSCGGFDENLRFAQDMLMWMKIFMNGFSIVMVDEPLVLSRLHGAQLTQKGQKIFHSDSMAIGNEVCNKLCELSSVKNNFLWAYAKYNAVYNNMGVVKRCITEGKKYNLLPWHLQAELLGYCVYGKIRPSIRTFYYCFVRPIKTREI